MGKSTDGFAPRANTGNLIGAAGGSALARGQRWENCNLVKRGILLGSLLPGRKGREDYVGTMSGWGLRGHVWVRDAIIPSSQGGEWYTGCVASLTKTLG